MYLNNFNNQVKMESVNCSPQYPFIFVNLNRGVTFYKVKAEKEYSKIIGSIIGDITIESLLSLAGVEGSLNEVIEESFARGDNLKVDMTVSDIYGEASEEILKLPSSLLAACMGKLQTRCGKDPIEKLDVAKSIWVMFCINLGQLISQNVRIENTPTIIINSTRITAEPFLYLLQSVLAFYSPHAFPHFVRNSEIMTSLRL